MSETLGINAKVPSFLTFQLVSDCKWLSYLSTYLYLFSNVIFETFILWNKFHLKYNQVERRLSELIGGHRCSENLFFGKSIRIHCKTLHCSAVVEKWVHKRTFHRNRTPWPWHVRVGKFVLLRNNVTFHEPIHSAAGRFKVCRLYFPRDQVTFTLVIIFREQVHLWTCCYKSVVMLHSPVRCNVTSMDKPQDTSTTGGKVSVASTNKGRTNS